MGRSRVAHVAERAGFEPAVGFPTQHFQCCTFSHSDTSPCGRRGTTRAWWVDRLLLGVGRVGRQEPIGKAPCVGRRSWRRGWDSNPRRPLNLTRFRVWHLQPLGHLSVVGAADHTQDRGGRQGSWRARDAGGGERIRARMDDWRSRRNRRSLATDGAQGQETCGTRHCRTPDACTPEECGIPVVCVAEGEWSRSISRSMICLVSTRPACRVLASSRPLGGSRRSGPSRTRGGASRSTTRRHSRSLPCRHHDLCLQRCIDSAAWSPFAIDP